MKLLMIIVPTECREELEVLLRRNEIAAYSEIPDAHGVGESGVRMGSRAHPKTSSIFFTVLEEDQGTRLHVRWAVSVARCSEGIFKGA